MEKRLIPGKDYIGVGVGALIVRADQTLLLLRKKAPEAGCWTIAGGKVEFGETAEAAILRELKEELGTEARIIAHLGVTDHIVPEENIHYIALRFLAELDGEPQNMELNSHEDMRWFDLNELPANITMTTEKAVEAYGSWKKTH